ncbi:MAG: major capsid protein [Microviridae sp.]|nr:MAG: major capsid protein [Microviridae sp.]
MAKHRGRAGSGNNYTFAQVPKAEIPRSSFLRNHTHKTTFYAGHLIPIYVDEVLPGDTFNLNMNVFGRLATPIFPIMDGLYLESFFFFVPNRLVWDNWQKFMGEKVNPDDTTEYLVPMLQTGTAVTTGSLGDYFGIPPTKALEVNALPFRAYNLIYNEWFRDQNLQDSLKVATGDSGDTLADYSIVSRGKRHDYFTSCLPWPQKGPGVEIPLGANAPVTITGNGAPTFVGASNPLAAAPLMAYGSNTDPSGGSLPGHVMNNSNSSTGQVNMNWSDPKLSGVADLTQATSITINSLRQAFQLQKLQERDARGGTRYVEILKAHFGVTSPDSRLQRPEFLGGGHSPIIINPVAQTSGTSAAEAPTPQGNLAGYGIVAGAGHGFHKSFVEHGYIIGLVSVRADMSYQQGLHKMWSRETKYDFYWPALAHIGEQAVLNKEIYASGTQVQDEEVFGYQERWAEYRYGQSKISGIFRSTASQPLDAWHLAQKFETLPTLGDTFITENPPIDRVIAVTTEPHFIFDSYFKINCVRPMPVYSVPGLIDHF